MLASNQGRSLPFEPVPFDPENSAESVGISPDGQFIIIAAWEQFYSILVAEDVVSK